MAIHLGGGAISKLMLGGVEIERAYLGSTVVLDSATPTTATLADVEAVPEVEAVFLARPEDLFVSGGGNVAALDDVIAEWRSTNGTHTLTQRNGTGIYWKNDGSFDRVAFESGNNGHLELNPTPDNWIAPMMLAAAILPETHYGLDAVTLAQTSSSQYYTRVYAEPGIPLVGVQTRTGGSNIENSGDQTGFDASARVVLVTLDNGTAMARVDGTDYPATSNLYGGGADALLAIGGLSDDTPFSGRGAVAAVVVTDGVPSTADRDTIEQWLASLVGVNV